MILSLIASAGANNEIGREGDLCWHIREDLRHFKQLTIGFPVIMGRKTWESLPKRPLPGRLNIVIGTPSKIEVAEGEENVAKASSLKEALSIARESGAQKAYIIGGASVYSQAIPVADRLDITRIFASDPEADTFFPEIDPSRWQLKEASDIMTSDNGVSYRFETYE